MEHRALGKGLSALIPEQVAISEKELKKEKITTINISKIRENSLQPRRHYDENKLFDLKASIKEKGILQPILVREIGDGYEVVAGERRLRAARDLNFDEIPVVVKKVSDEEALVLALVENIQREELNPIEEAMAFKRLLEEFRLTQEQIAFSVGKDRSTISNTLRLLKLPEEIQQAIDAGKISMGHARALLSVDDLQEQMKIFKRVVEKGLSVREVESITQPKLRRADRTKKGAQRSPDLILLEEDLQQILGSKVRLEAKKKRGKIIIEYYSLDDLERILQIIRR